MNGVTDHRIGMRNNSGNSLSRDRATFPIIVMVETLLATFWKSSSFAMGFPVFIVLFSICVTSNLIEQVKDSSMALNICGKMKELF